MAALYSTVFLLTKNAAIESRKVVLFANLDEARLNSINADHIKLNYKMRKIAGKYFKEKIDYCFHEEELTSSSRAVHIPHKFWCHHDEPNKICNMNRPKIWINLRVDCL